MLSCDETIRSPKTGLRRACPGKVNIEGVCDYRKFHLWTVKSGWCSNKSCEGTKPTVDGVPQKTCRLWQNCPCKCHDDISQLLASRKEQRVPYPDQYVYKQPYIVRWIRRYEAQQRILNNPEEYVRYLCNKWLQTDKADECTAEYIRSQSFPQKPLTTPEVMRVFSDWMKNKTAFIGGEPLRFMAFVK